MPEQDTSTEPEATAAPEAPKPTPPADDSTDWKAHSRSWESKAKKSEKEIAALRAEFDTLKQSQMSDAEKAIEQARKDAFTEGRKAALELSGQRLVQATLRSTLAGRREDGEITALLEGLDSSRFITSDGEPDEGAITAWVDRVAPKRAAFPDLGQGRREGAQPNDMNSLIRRAAGL